MEPLRDLHQLADYVVNNFKKNFNARDCKIPEEFKKKVKFLNSFSVVYNDYSVVIKGDGTRSFDSYVPNQCFYMASFFIEYSNELSKYKQKIIPWITNAGIPTSGLTAFFTEERDNGKQNITKGIDKFVNILDSIKYNESDRDNIIKFVTDYGWWHGSKTIDRSDFYNSPVLTIMGLTASSNAAMALIVNFLTQNPDMNSLLKLKAVKHIGEPLQQIFYGAPGTGKSHTIKEKTKGYEVIRTTFHPDSDYSTFVGAYKPTMGDPKPIYGFDSAGKTVKVQDPIGAIVKDRKIEYRFIKQAFLKAYLKAWKNYSDGVTTTTTTTITTPMHSSSTATPYKSKGSGTIAPTFDYTSDKGKTISLADLELLKKVDAFLFPFTDDIDCFGELHNTIEVIVTDKPTEDQLPRPQKVNVKSLREEFADLQKNELMAQNQR